MHSVIQQQATVQAPKEGALAAFLRRPIVLACLLAVVTVVLYYPVHTHPFVNYDDQGYVTENPQVTAGLSLGMARWALTTPAASNWHPLTWLSHALDCTLFGLDPAGHHMVNVSFHALNAVLLFWVLLRATGFTWRSFMAAALFALHPVNVESVAWIAERKTVLSTMFFLLALGAYTAYARRPRVTLYALVASLFALGLMAKPQVIILPFVLLLWDYWPLGRTALNLDTTPGIAASSPTLPRKSISALIIEKIPLFTLAAASAVITLHVQKGARRGYPRLLRVGNAVLSYALYMKNAFWPSRLALLYPHPMGGLVWREVFAAAIVLAVVTILVLIGRKHGYLPVGWFWFLGTLVPMLGIVQVGIQAMADRYAYISFIGLFIMVCWGVAEESARRRVPNFVLPAVSLIVLVALGAALRHQVNYWRSPVELWQHTFEITKNNWTADELWGQALINAGRSQEATPHFERVLRHEPDDPSANRALALNDLKEHRFADAIPRLEIAVKDKDAKPAVLRETYVALAKAYWEVGDRQKSRDALQASKTIAMP